MIITFLAWLFISACLVLPALFMPVGVNCTIFTDSFATDRTGTDYTTVSGSFTVSSNVMTTTSAGALIVENSSGSTGHGRVSVSGKVDTTGGSLRVIGSYTDSSNYLFGEMTINGGSSTLKLWKKVSGSDTQLGSTSTFSGSTATFYSVDLCWDGTTATTTINAGANFSTGAYTGTSNQAGLGASPNGGTVTFDDFLFEKHHSDDSACARCGCTSCGQCSGETPSQIQCVTTGVANTTCIDCGNFNATWIIDFLPFTPSGATNCCNYSGPNPAICSSVSGMTLTWKHPTIGEITFFFDGFSAQMRSGATSYPIDCLATHTLTCIASCNVALCDFTSAVVTVDFTAL
jgi:hypothetical protein